MSKYKVGEILNMNDGMYLAGRVQTVKPTIFGARYLIRVVWNDNTYTDYWRMWWRVWP